MSKTIVIEYKTHKNYCQCCDQKLPNAKTSEIKEFEVSKVNLMNVTNWKEIVEFEEDLDEIIREYVYETLSFFATNSYEKILIENSEFDKVKQFILTEVSTK